MEASMQDQVTRTMVDFAQMKAFAEDPLVLTSGVGIRVTDVEGRTFIDGLSGTFCAALGHGNARLADVGGAQLHRLAMAAPTMATNDRALELIDVLLGLVSDRYSVVKLFSGGSEATENAMKIARQYHKQTGNATKYKILSHYRAYHGGRATPWQAAGRLAFPYEPLAGVHPPPHAGPVPSAVRRRAGGGGGYLRLVEETIEMEGPSTIAALITEPILMSAGVVVPPEGYLPGLRELCDRHGILLIFDEIITAFGRVGRMFASELIETWPDILCLGKGMSGGYAPLSAVVMTPEVAGAFWGDPRDLVQFHSGHTYGANPVASRSGSPRSPRSSAGRPPHRGLRRAQDRHPAIGDGAAAASCRHGAGARPDDARASAELRWGRIRRGARRGLLLRAGHWMMRPAPLTISRGRVDEVSRSSTIGRRCARGDTARVPPPRPPAAPWAAASLPPAPDAPEDRAYGTRVTRISADASKRSSSGTALRSPSCRRSVRVSSKWTRRGPTCSGTTRGPRRGPHRRVLRRLVERRLDDLPAATLGCCTASGCRTWARCGACRGPRRSHPRRPRHR
jgi:adenosylmethionine-8-amino-7-oxononanoate aminotransferase